MHYMQDPAECRLLRGQRTKILRTPWPASSSSTSELSRTWRLPPPERAEASYKTHDDVSDIQHMDFSVIIIVRLLFPLLICQRFVFVTAFLLSSSLSDTRLVRLCSQLFCCFSSTTTGLRCIRALSCRSSASGHLLALRRLGLYFGIKPTFLTLRVPT